METEHKKTIAFIAGSGLAEGLEGVLENVVKRENVENKFGTVLSYYEGSYKGVRVIILPRHGDSMETPSRSPAKLVSEKGHEANIWQLKELGVTAIFGLSAVGSLDQKIPLADQYGGTFVLPSDYMRGFAASIHSFGSDAQTVHPNMGKPFDDELKERVSKAITNCGGTVYMTGLYIYDGGDQFETPAEIRALDRLTQGESNRLVGMTAVPEVILSKQVGIPYALICCNVNYAEGLSDLTPVSHDQTKKVMARAREKILHIATKVIESYAE